MNKYIFALNPSFKHESEPYKPSKMDDLVAKAKNHEDILGLGVQNILQSSKDDNGYTGLSGDENRDLLEINGKLMFTTFSGSLEGEHGDNDPWIFSSLGGLVHRRVVPMLVEYLTINNMLTVVGELPPYRKKKSHFSEISVYGAPDDMQIPTGDIRYNIYYIPIDTFVHNEENDMRDYAQLDDLMLTNDNYPALRKDLVFVSIRDMIPKRRKLLSILLEFIVNIKND